MHMASFDILATFTVGLDDIGILSLVKRCLDASISICVISDIITAYQAMGQLFSMYSTVRSYDVFKVRYFCIAL